MKGYHKGLAALIAVVVVTVGWSLAINPGVKSDSNKASDIDSISQDIEDYATDNNTLPPSLAALQPTGLSGKLSDYTYTQTNYDSYQLCATFAFATNQVPSGTYSSSGDGMIEADSHGAGWQCFSATVTGIVTAPFVKPASGTLTCEPQPEETMYTFKKVKFEGYNSNAQTVTIANSTNMQTFHLCGIPVLTGASGASMSLDQLADGVNVTAYVTQPAIVQANKEDDFAPYMTKLVVQN